jgi:DNA-binding MarR family transcriptional regulator
MNEIEATLSYQVVQFAKAHRQRAEEALSPLGVHVGQEQLLFLLWQEDGVSQSQLAEAACVDLSTITKAVQRMERAGLLRRDQDAEDARVSRVSLTEQGRALEAPTMRAWKALEARLVQHLTETEQVLLRRLLLQLTANLA